MYTIKEFEYIPTTKKVYFNAPVVIDCHTNDRYTGKIEWDTQGLFHITVYPPVKNDGTSYFQYSEAAKDINGSIQLAQRWLDYRFSKKWNDDAAVRLTTLY